MHLIHDENGTLCAHSHEHEHVHQHTYEHSHEHSHEHGHENEHDHTHEHSHAQEGCASHGCESGCSGCAGHEHHEHGHTHTHEAPQGDKMTALLDYMLKHNESHAAELDQVAEKMRAAGKAAAAEQIKKAVDEFQKGNLYLSLALSMVRDQQ